MASCRICVTVSAATTEELRRRRNEAFAQGADLVEVRLDSVRDPDVAAILAHRPGHVIVTCRPRWEGGAFLGSEDERRRFLREALTLGAEYVDVEWNAGFDEIQRARNGRGIIVSLHDFDGVPADLADRVRAMRGVGSEIVKVATTATRLGDVIPLLALAADSEDTPLLAIAMGTPGLVTRVCAARFGSPWTYAGDGVAPGQVPIDRLLRDFRFRTIGTDTDLYGIVGRPIGHSLSPVMHNAAFDTIGRNAVYLPFEAADADDFLSFADALRVHGTSVTAPFKRALFERATNVDDLSRRVGALNTLQRDPTGWRGTNTDVPGFLAPLAGYDRLRDSRVAVLGAGGAARAVVVALASSTQKITVCARDVQAAARVAALVGVQAAPIPPPPGSWDLLVNTTPVGTAPHVDETLVPARDLDGSLVYDLVYNPRETRLLREAAAMGCQTIGGLEMLIAQAQQQFSQWTQHEVAADVFRAAAERRLSEEAGVSAV